MNRLELKDWRRTRYLSQAALAELLGVATNTVNRWEIGERDFPPFLSLALERLDQLYTWAPDGGRQTSSLNIARPCCPIGGPETASGPRELFKALRRLPHARCGLRPR